VIHGCPQFFYFPRRERSGICLGMILYVFSAHALKDEMKADSICVLFMSEEGIGLEQKRESGAWKAFQEAFPYTVPIFAGFWFVAFSYGIYMHSMGFGFLYPALMAAFIFGGSLEFVVVTMLMSPFAPLDAFVMALMVQSRHLFYGISMLEKYENMGWKKPFLMFWMCDETFALNYTATVPRDVDRGWFMLWVSFLNYFYWVSGATVGGLLGSLAAFDTKGLSFVMTALFTVIFLEQFLREKKHYTAMIGGVSAVGCLAVFGTESFILPAMGLILAAITLLRKPIEKAGGFL